MKRAVLILSVALLLALLTSTVASAEPLEWSILGYHTVQSGETLYCIARAYGVDPWAIASQNGVVNPNCIHPGMVLAIPNAYASLPGGRVCARQFGTGTPGCACIDHYTIACGDTLTGISLAYGVSMWHIAECNNIINLNYIRAGEVLCIPDP